jgi:hypothetical protein
MKNWRTTLAGIIGGAVSLAADMYTGGMFTAAAFAKALVPVILGYLAKDAGVTGTAR